VDDFRLVLGEDSLQPQGGSRWKSLTLIGMLSLSRRASALSFGVSLRIHAWDGGSVGRNPTLKGSDARRVGCAEAMEKAGVLSCLSFLLLAWESAEEKGGIPVLYVEVTCAAIDRLGEMGGRFRCLYIYRYCRLHH